MHEELVHVTPDVPHVQVLHPSVARNEAPKEYTTC